MRFFFVEYTDLSMSQIMQRQSLHYAGNTGVLRHLISQVAGLLEPLEGEKKMRAFNAIDITLEQKIVTLEVCKDETRLKWCLMFTVFSGWPIR